MNHTNTSSWLPDTPFNTHGTTPDEEFAKFLDIDLSDLDINFPVFDPHANDSGNIYASMNHDLGGGFHDIEMGNSVGYFHNDQQVLAGRNYGVHPYQPFEHQHVYQERSIVGQRRNSGVMHGNEQAWDSKPQVHLAKQSHEIPATPNSLEIYGQSAHVSSHRASQDQASHDVPHQMRGDDLIDFTPLASPAVTPYDTEQISSPAFTAPGVYFSPLTSPALHGQNQVYRSVPSARPSTAQSSLGTSPIDLDVDMLGDAALPQQDPPRKSLKRTTTARRSTSSTRVRQSPIVKPQRRKATFNSPFPPQEIEQMIREVKKSKDIQFDILLGAQPMATGPKLPSTESVSPKPHPATLMGPPPKRDSLFACPTTAVQANFILSNGTRPNVSGPLPVTPASLMQLRQEDGLNHSELTLTMALSTEETGLGTDAPSRLCDLPSTMDASMYARPSLARSNTQIRDEEATPRLGADRLIASRSSETQASTASSSFLNSLGPSTKSPTEPMQLKRAESSAVRSGKKGEGSTSTLISPALRPRNSPSIKPLLPEGALSTDAHTLLLATRSNYQNILEGTHVPGVHYPEDFSRRLTSKRTSHKLAEQGRRNRINVALQEMATLLPSAAIRMRDNEMSWTKSEKDSSDKAEGTAKGEWQVSTSKAATVEAAIEYIHLLREQLAEKDKEVLEMRTKLAQVCK